MTVAACRNLVLAILGLTVTSWAWNLLSPLGHAFKSGLGLTEPEAAALVAVPLLAGSLGRVPVGALTDRYGARVMFPLVSGLTIVPVLLLAPAKHSYAEMLAVSCLLGLGGTTFAIGIPLVNAWFPPRHRGLALGLAGLGTGGIALSGYLTPRLHAYDENLPYLVVAVALALFAFLGALLIDDHPDQPVPRTSPVTRLARAGRRRITWELAGVYALAFGGLLALAVYLPTYLVTWYRLGAGGATTGPPASPWSPSSSGPSAAGARTGGTPPSSRPGRWVRLRWPRSSRPSTRRCTPRAPSTSWSWRRAWARPAERSSRSSRG